MLFFWKRHQTTAARNNLSFWFLFSCGILVFSFSFIFLSFFFCPLLLGTLSGLLAGFCHLTLARVALAVIFLLVIFIPVLIVVTLTEVTLAIFVIVLLVLIVL